MRTNLLNQGDLQVVATIRNAARTVIGAPTLEMGEIDAHTRWEHALVGVDVVVHLAGRAHVMHETQVDPLIAYREMNTAGTLNLSRQAASAGARFLYLSAASRFAVKDKSDLTKMPTPKWMRQRLRIHMLS
ncbi:MAG: NAD-dependent epimerase/dehydratase family protein [Halioglobus sp.]|nr:NAD-dependent epimerase/dehydratase family protein [Halioglobus sp.]